MPARIDRRVGAADGSPRKARIGASAGASYLRGVFDERGRMRLDPSGGVALTYTYDVFYDAFWRWLTSGLDLAVPTTEREPPGGPTAAV